MQNLPTGYAMDMGLLKTNEILKKNKFGKTVTVIQTRITGKGQKYILDKFLSGKWAA